MAANEWGLQWEGDGNKHRLYTILTQVRIQDEELVVREVFTSNLMLGWQIRSWTVAANEWSVFEAPGLMLTFSNNRNWWEIPLELGSIEFWNLYLTTFFDITEKYWHAYFYFFSPFTFNVSFQLTRNGINARSGLWCVFQLPCRLIKPDSEAFELQNQAVCCITNVWN